MTILTETARNARRTSLHDVRKQRKEASAFDSASQFPLLFRGHRCDAARNNLTTFGNIPTEQSYILMIDLWRVGARERARFTTAKETTFHNYSPSLAGAGASAGASAGTGAAAGAGAAA